MKSKNVLIAIPNRIVRARLINQFHTRGFNLIADDMREPLDSSFLHSMEIDCSVIGNPEKLPGGYHLLDSLQNRERRTATVVLFESPEGRDLFDTQKYPFATPLLASDDWDKIICGLMMQALTAPGSHAGRRHARKQVAVPAACEIAPHRPIISCQLTNISSSGAFISANGFVPKVGQIVEIEVNMGPAGESKLVISGVVRWAQPDAKAPNSGFGLEFGFCNVHEKDFLDSFDIDS